MDLRGFTVKSQGEDHIVLHHPDGHEVKIMHKNTSHQNKGGVEAYADGGKVADKRPVPPPVDPKDAANVRKAFIGYADGGQVDDQTAAAMGAGYGVGVDQPAVTDMTTPAPDTSYLESLSSNRTPLSRDVASDLHKSSAPSDSGNPQIAPTPQAAPQGDVFGTNALASATQTGVGNQIAGIKGEAKAQGALGTQQSGILDKSQEELKAIQDHYEDQFTDLNLERDKLLKDISDQHIDPQHYIGSKDSVGKIATGIGLILGGMGAGLTGGPNQALEFLNKQIDRDIEAQRMKLGVKETLLSANMKQFGNLHDAMAMTRVNQMDIVSNQLQQAAAKSQDPMAKARAQQAIGYFQQKAAPLMSQSAGRQAILKAGENGQVSPTTQIRMLLPHDEQEKALGDLKVAEKTAQAHKAVDEISDKLADLQTAGSRLGSPIQSKQKIDALSAELVPLIMESSPSKRLTHESLKAEILPLIRGFTTSPKTADQMKMSLHRLIDTHADSPTHLEGTGIPYPKYNPTKGFNAR